MLQSLSLCGRAGTVKPNLIRPQSATRSSNSGSLHRLPRVSVSRMQVRRATDKPEVKTSEETKNDVEKYGLEAGLFKTLTDKSTDKATKTADAKDLLKRYGSAYLITSISFAIVSYAICYLLVARGVDVAALLARVGIASSNTNEKVGTAAIAYAAHKAASPIRFPPTVALTPIVAKWLGKEVESSGDADDDQQP
mmetsp:Transcript_30025/g.84728  ORF Transcript_30025/g.84728 Transcript_30025/m.84728 type:complete len:195 (-) Transcript_30025:178-762(-)|eukprot:CAMPEP_0117677290 /NCGR_PEP_ID=MMETSP0804-20121206/16667_1 /TAXON_ID=1074897 /ORGANISM="Tetraselmis astigmatica, Strain CCMP880" /LENGTH=194 /DNA_ID=CAMNT_0005486565 /DNA_START=181 /DNA_END=765 /DNA_ORIENTATION=+